MLLVLRMRSWDMIRKNWAMLRGLVLLMGWDYGGDELARSSAMVQGICAEIRLREIFYEPLGIKS